MHLIRTVKKHTKLQKYTNRQLILAPPESIIIKHLVFIESIKLFTVCLSTFCHSLCIKVSNSSIFDCFRFSTRLFRIDHIFSIGLRSGLLGGQTIFFGTSRSKNSLAALLLCFESLFCRNLCCCAYCCLAAGRR